MPSELDSSSSSHRHQHQKYGDAIPDKRDRKRKHKTSGHASISPSKKLRDEGHTSITNPENDISDLAHTAELSPFHQQTYSLYLTLSPIGQQQPIQTLCAEHISPLLLTYFPPFHGVIISYHNPRLSTESESPLATDGRKKVFARSVDAYAATFVWLTADFLVLKPQRGDSCEGFVTLQNETNIALLCWNFFSATIERKRLPRDWCWVSADKSIGSRKQKLKKVHNEDDVDMDEPNSHGVNRSENFDEVGGYFVDQTRNRISGVLQFNVRDADTSSSTSRDFDFFSIIGSMLSYADEEKSTAQVQVLGAKNSKGGRDSYRIQD